VTGEFDRADRIPFSSLFAQSLKSWWKYFSAKMCLAIGR